MKKIVTCQPILRLTAILVAALAVLNAIYYLSMEEVVSSVTTCIIGALLVLVSCLADACRLPPVLLPVAVVSFVLFYTTNYVGTYYSNLLYGAEFLVSAAGCIAGSVIMFRHRERPKKPPVILIVLPAILLAGALAVWGIQTNRAKAAEASGKTTIWAVPERYDTQEAAQQGTVEKITYRTKAYATDEREVEKSAYVYLPYGYDETKEYNILYLLHGTGNDESYWLIEKSYNKTMLDNMIADGVIEPLIVVTPTFYVEDDCMDDQDKLTYSFQYELRNDLMPAVESTYSTYAESCDAQGFEASRDHRAFAGLSRGAVTTLHSAMCGSLDWFSWFGAFSGSRTTAEEFQQTVQSEEFSQYPINYLYFTSGSFDFALPTQLKQYSALLDVEPRLTEGTNTAFDVYPVRYHSMGSWHLALYNFLTVLF